MATDFDRNALVLSGGLKPSTKNTPGDIRTRIESITDMELIPLPYIGMLVYVIDEEEYYVIKSLKSKKVGPIDSPDSVVDEFEKFNPCDVTKEYVQEEISKIELMPGPKGDQGEKGEDGQDGINGVDGKDGKDFTYDMFTEEQLEALRGPKGDQGIQGIQGIQGEKGVDGQNGIDGKDFTYDMFTEEQLEALRGPAGVNGINGVDGVDGKDFTYDMFTEEQLEALRGPAGADGVNGVDGKDFTYDMFTEEQLEALKGDQGLQGEKGDKGDQGEKGDKGDQGEKGEFDAETIFDILNTENKTVLGAINELLNMITGYHPGIPEGTVMYYGYIPYEITNDEILSYSDIEFRHLQLEGAVIETTEEALDKTSLGQVPEAAYMIVAIPEGAGFVAKKDDGFGGLVPFDESSMGANGVKADFDGVSYLIYGELALAKGERFIYIVEE